MAQLVGLVTGWWILLPILTQGVAFGELTVTVDLGALVGVVQYLKDEGGVQTAMMMPVKED